MGKLKHNDPCHCGSGKKYRQCHLQADRQAKQVVQAAPTQAAAPTPVEKGPRPLWVRVLPWIVGVAGTAGAAWIALERGPEAGGAMLVGTGLAVGAIIVFGDPPPPKEKTGDPAGIDFGR